MTVLRISPMRRRHIRSVMAIDAQVYPQPWGRQLYLDGLADRGGRFHLVAHNGPTLVGHGALMFVHPDAHITTVAVDPVLQGDGIGSRLVSALARHAVAAGYEALTLEVRASNQPAQAVYRRFGLAPVGVRPRYYRDVDGEEDAVIMWAHGIDSPAFLARLDEIDAMLPGRVVVDDGVVAAGGRS